ncbi:MAG: replicative DNA helicase [Dehalococcoidales bacterium]|nr:replicative DNA helicase [Dehalococcoidales bacterium]MDZ4231105.1 replicative DNA helicase [Dehalococcoidales bacterium]
MNSEKLPPHDIDAEEATIGSLLIDGTAIFQIATFLQPPDFYREQNQWLYGACLSLFQRSEAIDQITVAQELDRQGRLAECGGAAYLSHLVSMVPTSLDIEHYARIVHRLSISRHLIDAARQIEAIGYRAEPDVDDSLNKAEDVLFRLRHGQSPRDFIHVRQVLDKYFETPPPQEADGHQGPITRVMSGFTGVDEFLSGFQRSDLIIVAGRPSMGKTSLALNIARNVAVERGGCVAVFSLEMSRESLVLRFLSSEAEVNLKQVRLGLHTEADEKRIMDATGILSEASIYIDDSSQLRVVEMRSKARRLHYERGIDLIIVDYLQLMQGESRGGENRVQEIGYISRSLKALARDLDVPVLAVSQLSRAVEWRSSHKPQLSDLRESGSIEQDADVVMFIYRDEVYYPDQEQWEVAHPGEAYPPPAEVIIAKHRNGPIGQAYLRFIPKLAKFDNLPNAEPSLL